MYQPAKRDRRQKRKTKPAHVRMKRRSKRR